MGRCLENYKEKRNFVLKKLTMGYFVRTLSMIWIPNPMICVEFKKTTERKDFKEGRRVTMRKI